MKRILILLMVVILVLGAFAGCEEQSDIVSHNLSKEADNFNVIRQITVMHGITGETVFQMTGRLSIEEVQGRLEVIVEYNKGMYAKHFFFIGDNGQCIVEQLRPAAIDEYNYTLNMNPKMWLPIKIQTVD